MIQTFEDFIAGRGNPQKFTYQYQDMAVAWHARDAEIAELRAYLNQLGTELERAITERENFEEAIQRIHILLGGDGEWACRLPPPPPPGSGDLGLDCEFLVSGLKAQLVEIRKAYENYKSTCLATKDIEMRTMALNSLYATLEG